MSDTLVLTPNRQCLFDHAAGQLGYFTAAQAQRCGYSAALLSHHVRAGRFQRLRRGLYRISEYPSSAHEATIAAWLAVGPRKGVVSHESALELLDLADVSPNTIHLTIPRTRRGLHAPDGVTLHTTTALPAGTAVIEREGMRLTEPLRTVLDAAEWGTAPEQIVLAIQQSLARGLFTVSELQQAAAARPQRVVRLVDTALAQIDDLQGNE